MPTTITTPEFADTKEGAATAWRQSAEALAVAEARWRAGRAPRRWWQGGCPATVSMAISRRMSRARAY